MVNTDLHHCEGIVLQVLEVLPEIPHVRALIRTVTGRGLNPRFGGVSGRVMAEASCGFHDSLSGRCAF